MKLVFMDRGPLCFFILVVLGFIAGCNYGPFDPLRQEEIKKREVYVALVNAQKSHDEIFFFNKAQDSLLLNAVYVTTELQAQGLLRWRYDDRYTATLQRWTPSRKPEVLVLLGIHARGFSPDDLLKSGRFSVELVDGQELVKPLASELVKPDFLADYFPAFNPWEDVFMFRFPAPTGGPKVLAIRWPAGRRDLSLVEGS